MNRSLSIAFAVCASTVVPPPQSPAQDAQARPLATHTHPVTPAPGAPAARAETPDFKVVFWFHGSEWKHQVYDVRKGQYTKAVDDWVRHIEIDRSGYVVVPGRMATVRSVYLSRESGASEAEKLRSAIEREEVKILGPPGEYRSRSPQSLVHITGAYDAPVTREAFKPPMSSDRAPGMSSPAPFLSRPSSSPFPYPYARPHP